MNITFFSVAHMAFGGGYEQQIIKLATALAEKGHKITLLTFSKSATYKLAVVLSFLYFHPRFNFPELQKKEKNIFTNKNFIYLQCQSLIDLKKYLIKSDVIYAKNELLDSLVLRFAVDKKTPPIIAGMHTVLQYVIADSIHAKLHNAFYKSFLYSSLLQIYSGFHCVSHQQAKQLKEIVGTKKIFIIPNFVLPVSQPKRISKDIFQVLFVGRLTEQKGADYLIATIKELSKKPQFKKIRFVICGNGNYEKEIKELEKQYSNVFYKGFIQPKDMQLVYKESDVLLFPSKGESFGLVCIEAQQFGVPVIAFDSPAMHNVVIQNKTGFLVPIDLSALVKKLLLLFSYKNTNKKKYLKMSKDAKKFSESQFTAQAIVPKIEGMFVTIAKNKHEK